MKVFSFIIEVLFILALAIPANARLGESMDECVGRYGRVIEIRDKFRPDFPQYVFIKNDVEICVRFREGRAGQLIISSEKGMPKSLLAEILHANDKGFEWKLDTKAKRDDEATYSESIHWVRSDGAATARYIKDRAYRVGHSHDRGRCLCEVVLGNRVGILVRS